MPQGAVGKGVRQLSVYADAEGQKARERARVLRNVAPCGDVADAVVLAAQRGDHRAFAAIVEHYDGRLRALAFHVLHDPEALDDAMQEAYVKAYRGLGSFHGTAALGTWLHRLTYTTCLNMMRARSRRPSSSGRAASESPAAAADPADSVAGADRFAWLLGACRWSSARWSSSSTPKATVCRNSGDPHHLAGHCGVASRQRS